MRVLERRHRSLGRRRLGADGGARGRGARARPTCSAWRCRRVTRPRTAWRDAEALARALGIGYEVIPIDTVFQSYLDVLAPVLGGGPLGATEENVQARVRGAVLMAISNRRGSILLSTGNKSELAVGYCTLYGDMCGGLAVISDVPKTAGLPACALRQPQGRRSSRSPRSPSRPAPSSDPIRKTPTRCRPYEILDPIIAAYVERHLDAAAIVRLGFDPAVVADVIRRIDSSEYKRRQMAPGIKISSKAFGVGRRYPIAAEYRY